MPTHSHLLMTGSEKAYDMNAQLSLFLCFPRTFCNGNLSLMTGSKQAYEMNDLLVAMLSFASLSLTSGTKQACEMTDQLE